jgi:hypothetical protein
MAIGACGEDSASSINGDSANNNAVDSGAVYIFVRSGNDWSQQAYIKAENSKAGDWFGVSVDLSADGNTLAVGAVGEFSDNVLVGCASLPTFTPTLRDGTVYVFTRTGGNWKQEGNIKASNAEPGDLFGISVKLSADGNTLAVGAPYEDGSANGATNSGAAYVFVRSGVLWTEQSYIKASNTNAQDFFGWAVALSADGNTLAVGAYGEDSNANTINGNENNNNASLSGAVYVFVRSSGTWTQQAYVKSSNARSFDRFGWSVALSVDGNTLAVGARNEGTTTTQQGAGAAYVFVRSSGTWTQQAYIKATNAEAKDRFGWSLALSADGNILAVGAYAESSNAIGVEGDQASNNALESGAVYVFSRSGSAWARQAYVKATNTEAYDGFGASLALSADAKTMAVGAWQEASSATGIGGNQADNNADRSGAVYLF